MNSQINFTVFDVSDKTYAKDILGRLWGSKEEAISFGSQIKAEEWINSTIHESRKKYFEIHVVEYERIIIIEHKAKNVIFKLPYSNNQQV